MPGFWYQAQSAGTGGGGGSNIRFQDEGSTLDSAITSINVVGAGAKATNSGHQITVTIPGAVKGSIGGGDRPAAAAANEGMVFYGTDTFLWYISNGAAWTTVVVDHGTGLNGLSDDDHPQYVLRSILTTRGDLPYRGASDWTRLAIGTSGKFLKSDGTDPGWATITTGDVSGYSAAQTAFTSKTASYTATVGDFFIAVSAASSFTVTLYAASGNSGKVLHFKRTDATTNTTVTIDANGAETIDGALSVALGPGSQYIEVALFCDGTGWQVF